MFGFFFVNNVCNFCRAPKKKTGIDRGTWSAVKEALQVLIEAFFTAIV